MNIILIPGFWLDASSWSEVTPPLVAAGHRVHPLTLSGLEAADAPRAGVGLQDHIDAVVAKVDTFDQPVILVGHSGGGAISYGVADARPDRVARIIYVDSVPLGDGSAINDELPAAAEEIPLPEWDLFDEEDLTDLSDDLRAAFRARAIPQPRRVAQDAQQLSDDRRLEVPATVIACAFPSAQLQEWIAAGDAHTAELARLKDVDYIDLPTGHWPQFTKPAELGEAILAAVGRVRT